MTRALLLLAALVSCGPATQLPIASPADCAAAGWPHHLWRGQSESVCPDDPTAYPQDPAGNIVHFEARRHRDCIRVVSVEVRVSLVGDGGGSVSPPSPAHWLCRAADGGWEDVDAGVYDAR